jgi:NADPH:quinone reductase-like Zn-dependent oxidoreductase
MRAMRAESFTGYGGLKLVEVPRPTLGDGRVLVRITAAGVTPLDHTILSGGYPRATAPLVLGTRERASWTILAIRRFQSAPG